MLKDIQNVCGSKCDLNPCSSSLSINFDLTAINNTASSEQSGGAFVFSPVTIRIPHFAFSAGHIGLNYTMDELSHFLELKYRFRNGKIYSDTYRGIERILGWSITKVIKYFKRFKKLGWVSVDGGIVRFLRLRDLFCERRSGDRKVVKLMCRDYTHGEISKSLYLAILENKKRQVDRIISLKGEYQKNQGRSGYRACRILSKMGYNVSASDRAADKRFMINYSSISRLFNVSKTKAHSIIKSLIGDGVIMKFRNRIKVMGCVSSAMYSSIRNMVGGYSYVDSRNNLYLQLPNDYLLFPYKIIPKK